MIKPPINLRSFESLIQVVQALRNPNGGCPWDLEQTHASLTPHLLEETHELIEAIESCNRTHMIEELGDVLLQVMLHAEIARQEGQFTLTDIIEALNQKLVSRHSHVFSDVEATSAQEAMANWEKMKAKEKQNKPQKQNFEIPISLPSLQRAQKFGAKTKKFNFDWSTRNEVLTKVEEELEEFKISLQEQKPEETEMELGDILFSVAQLARHSGIDAECALRKANAKFERRFFQMKQLAESKGLKLETTPPQDLEVLWIEIKKLEKV